MCAIASGNWNNSGNSGPGALNCNNTRGNSNNNVVLRLDSISPQGSRFDRSGIKGDAFRRARQLAAKSVCFRLSGRATCRLEGLAT